MDTTTTTETETNPIDQLTAAERAQVRTMFERLSAADREQLTATGMVVAFMVDAAKHLIAWRGRE
jgi:hypothetical protein